MQCPYCHEDDDRVVNSRPSTDGTYVKRRRECNNCSRRYTTYERVEMSVLRIIKKDGTREDFSRQKLKAGLDKACYKRPISSDIINDLVDRVERELHRRFSSSGNWTTSPTSGSRRCIAHSPTWPISWKKRTPSCAAASRQAAKPDGPR
jgi:transcriptional regulator NrdR